MTEVNPRDTAEVAMLYYHDGTSRLMSSREAMAHMTGVKLEKNFWEQVRMLQSPVSSGKAGSPTRYITYSFDSRSFINEPQSTLELGMAQLKEAGNSPARRKKMGGGPASRVKEVVKQLNLFLASPVTALPDHPQQQPLKLISGELEFVLDEAMDLLWLVNASNLKVCSCVDPAAESKANEEKEERENKKREVKYFEEEEFDAIMREESEKLETFKRRVLRDMPIDVDGGQQGRAELHEKLSFEKRSDLERFVKVFDTKGNMLKFYEDEINPLLPSRAARSAKTSRAVGLLCWFRRWVKGCHRKP